MSRYDLVARVASSSTSRQWEVKTPDGETLSCACPGWVFSRTRTGSEQRTCRHVEAVLADLSRAGLTVRQAVALMRRGIAVEPPASRPAAVVTVRASVERCDRACVDALAPSDRPAPLRRCRHGRRVRDAMLDMLRPRDEAVATVTVPATTPEPYWLGGVRAIILSDS